MGALFAILITPLRAVLILMTIGSVSVTVLIAVRRNEPPFNPFAPYADILPGQSWDALLQRGFHCQLILLPSFDESCWLSPETGMFSSIQITIARDTGRVSQVSFTLREKILTVGDLALLWGRPAIATYSRIVNLRWRNVRAVAIPQTDRGHFSYLYPIVYVAFVSAG